VRKKLVWIGVLKDGLGQVSHELCGVDGDHVLSNSRSCPWG
jgi:hypothetical protein